MEADKEPGKDPLAASTEAPEADTPLASTSVPITTDDDDMPEVIVVDDEAQVGDVTATPATTLTEEHRDDTTSEPGDDSAPGATSEPSDDKTSEPGDDNGKAVSEPGDDSAPGATSEPGDDNGKAVLDPGDDSAPGATSEPGDDNEDAVAKGGASDQEDKGNDDSDSSDSSSDEDSGPDPFNIPNGATITMVPEPVRKAAIRSRRTPADDILDTWTAHPFDPYRYFSRKYDYYIYYDAAGKYIPLQFRHLHPARDYMAFPAGKELYRDYPYTPSEYQPRRLHPYMFINPRIMRGFRPSKIIRWLEKADAETRIDIIQHVGKKTLYSYLDAKMREMLLYDLVIGLKEPIERVERDYTWSWWREYVQRNVGLAAVFAVFMLSATYIVKRVFSYIYDVPVPMNLGGPTPAQRAAAAAEPQGSVIDQLWAPIEWMGAQYMAQSNATPVSGAGGAVVADLYAGVGDDELDVDEADYADMGDAPLTSGPVQGDLGARPGGPPRGTLQPGNVRPNGVGMGAPRSGGTRPGGVDMGSDYGPTPAPLAGSATTPDWTPAGSNAVGGSPMIEGFVDGPPSMSGPPPPGTGSPLPGMGTLTTAFGNGGAAPSITVPIRAIWLFYVAQLILSGLLLLYLYNATVRKETWTTFLPMDFSFANVWTLFGLYQAIFFVFMVVSLTDRLWGISGSTFFGYPVGMYPSMGARGVYKDVFYHWMIFSMYLVLSLSAILLLLPFLKVHKDYSEKQKWLGVFNKGCRPVLKT